jgi:hypothetical protein
MISEEVKVTGIGLLEYPTQETNSTRELNFEFPAPCIGDCIVNNFG